MNQTAAPASRRLILWTWVFGLLLAAAFGGRLVSSVAFAYERGKLQALQTELDKLGSELAAMQNVSRAFNLVASLARPGVVQVVVAAGQYDADYARDQLRIYLRFEAEEDEALTDSDKAAMLKFLESGKREDLNPLINAPQRGSYWRQRLYRGGGSGSGLIFDAAGYILTNNHVVEGRAEVSVLLHDDRRYAAKVVGLDPKTDLAVLKIDAPDLHALSFGDSDKVQVGDWVVAIGAPFGLTQSVTHGIVSAVGRAEVGLPIPYQNFIQTDAAINPGNSGGPLLNLRAEVVGVNTAIAANEEFKNAGVAFVVPSRTAKRVAAELRSAGVVTRGWLGVSLADLEPDYAEVFGLTETRGVVVTAVFDGTPADKAGLEVDDVIVTLNGEPALSVQQLRGIIAEQKPDETVNVKYYREGTPREMQIQLSDQPKDFEAFARATPSRSLVWLPELGYGGRTFRPGMRDGKAFESDKARGVLVSGDEKDSARLGNFNLLIECNGEPIRSITDLRLALAKVRAGDKVKLKFRDPIGDALLVEREIQPRESKRKDLGSPQR